MAFALLLATPLTATVWTRSNVLVQIPKGARRIEVANASYAARDWAVAVKAIELKETSRPVQGNITVTWVFHYTNTDSQPHYAALSIRCLDARRSERARFETTMTLEANRAGGGTVEISSSVREDDWKASSLARVVVDFLSAKEG
ncbi:MAG: hypothetical protein IPP07_01830 [Holophagales bacterium]|nr:hypothetical protein [Holophagales bacterium]